MTNPRTHDSLIHTTKAANFSDLKSQILSLSPLLTLGLPEDEKTEENVFQSILTNKNLTAKEQEELLNLLLFDRDYISCRASDCLLTSPLVDLMLKDKNFYPLITKLFEIVIAEKRHLRQDEEINILKALSLEEERSYQKLLALMKEHRGEKNPLKERLVATLSPRERLNNYLLKPEESDEQFWRLFKDDADITKLSQAILKLQPPQILKKYMAFLKLDEPQQILDFYLQNASVISQQNKDFLWDVIIEKLLKNPQTLFDFYQQNLRIFSKENELTVWSLLLDKSDNLHPSFVWIHSKQRLAEIFKMFVKKFSLRNMMYFAKYWESQCHSFEEAMAAYHLIKQLIKDTKFVNYDTFFHKIAKQRILQIALETPDLTKSSGFDEAPVVTFLAIHRPSKFGLFQCLHTTSSKKTFQQIQNGELIEAKAEINAKQQKLEDELSKILARR
ncbi:MAG: hypothetical protein ACYCQI_13220 [Gammaproteobacteria bacterium]